MSTHRMTRGKEMYTSVEFMIDTHFLIPVSMMSPKNVTYTTSNVSLTVLCSEKINSAYYRLDDMILLSYLSYKFD